MKYRVLNIQVSLAIVIFAMAPASAMAYVDPGNGAYMVQVLFTLVGAALFYLRHPIRTLKTVWRSLITSRSDGEKNKQADVISAQEASVPLARGHSLRDEI